MKVRAPFGGEGGHALVTVLLLTLLFSALLASYFAMTRVGLATTEHSMDTTRGFYAAEAGLNLRAGDIRSAFVGYLRPTGTPPTLVTGVLPCDTGSPGTGDFACESRSISGRQVQTFVNESPDNPTLISIPPGETFEYLTAQEYQYTVGSISADTDGHPEAILELELVSRLVPLFQFAAFYDKDLEILPGEPMTLAGPVHTNGDLYLGAGDSLDLLGQVTAAGDLYRGRKNEDSCMDGTVTALDPASPLALSCPGTTRERFDESDLSPWRGHVRVRVDPIGVPEPESLDPAAGSFYWDRADLRVMLDVTGTPTVQVRNIDGSVNAAATTTLGGCGAASYSNSFYDNREGSTIRMLDVDVEALFDCIHDSALLGATGLDDTTGGGLVFYLGVNGPDATVPNDYGIRLRNGQQLASTTTGAPPIRGLTVATNQAAFIEGNFNSDFKRPAAVLADSLNILSGAWNDGDSTEDLDDADRDASSTIINAAFLAGTDTTGAAEGVTGQDVDGYNGGLENFPRFHEDWSSATLTYRGSFVSLGEPRHVDGPWGSSNVYSPPTRDWNYDVDFDDATNLPPLTPRFVYLRQIRYTRTYDY